MRLTRETSRHAAHVVLTARFAEAGIEEPEREAALLIAAAAELRSIDLIVDPDAPLGDCAQKAEAFSLRRLCREPLSRILGRREFWGLSFSVNRYVLDPRADTETVIEAALDELQGRTTAPLRIIDFGVGSGALLAALLSEFPNATGIGVDFSELAAHTARVNLTRLGFADRAAISVGNWGAEQQGPFDLIVSNPPYIPTGELPALSPEVKMHDPNIAIDGGPDGLDAYRALGLDIARLIAPATGRFVLEHGLGQGRKLQAILQAAGLQILRTRKDLASIDRVILGRLPPFGG